MPPNSFHEKAGERQAISFFSPILSFPEFFSEKFHTFFLPELFPVSQAAPVAILPSALFGERYSLGARWVFSFQ
jgi:hypothetical protein